MASDPPLVVRDFEFVSSDERIREVAREEVTSLCGLVLGRLNADPQEPLAQKLASAFAEVLRDFSQTRAEPGPKEDD